MDVDDDVGSQYSDGSSFKMAAETIFAKSDQLTVSFYADLPAEVSQILRNADFYTDSYTGGIDTLTGFALVASAQTCFVWQHSQALKGIPTCYIFSCPTEYTQTTPPFHGLFPHGSAREPGLILLSVSGEIRFWNSIGVGLAGGEHYSTAQLDIASGQFITNLIRADHRTFIASTSDGVLFRIVLSSTAGSQHLSHHAFAKPTSSMSFSRFLPAIFSPSTASSTEPGNVSGVALAGKKTLSGGHAVWALVDSRLQKWDMKLDGWEDLLFDEDVITLLRSALRARLSGIEQDNSKLDLELVDLAAGKVDDLYILVSYAGNEAANSALMDLPAMRRLYALIYVSYDANGFNVTHVRAVPYQCTSSSGAPMHPRVQILGDGQLATVQFGDAIAIVSCDSHYTERMELKSSRDRTLGVGTINEDMTILVLTAATMMKASLDMVNLRIFDPNTGRADLIKSIMTQAILYGSLPNNPLHFTFPPEVDEESLMKGAEQLSEAVLKSDPDLVRRNHDLSAQLAARKDRLTWLIRFINDNAVLEKMSQSSRQKLATDSEMLDACYHLWLQHNELLMKHPTHSVLNDIVYAMMHESENAHHEDFMRAFFKLHVADVPTLLRKIPDVTIKAAKEVGQNVAELLPEANQIILTALKSAFEYREENSRLYGIQLPRIDPWTSRPAIIDVILTLFESSSRVVETAEGDLRSKGQPYTQLPELAAHLLACVQERLDWLSSIDDKVAERTELNQRFVLLRPQILETLRRHGHGEAAFSLAEKYRDFSSLAELCHRDTVFPPDENPNAARIKAYVERFKDEFTTELYRWYIQHGELRVMFSQESSRNLDQFFSKNPYPLISWINDLGNGWYDSAAKTLLDEAERATWLENKHLMLSIGKLSHLAHLQAGSVEDDASLLDSFHDGLDFVSVYEAIRQECEEVIQKLRGRQSLDAQVEAVVQKKAPSLSKRRMLESLFRNMIRTLLQGKVLSVEDMADILSLKDNKETAEDYATALHLIAGARDIPESRKLKQFYAVWRRIYLHDNWDSLRDTANVSDAELAKRFRQTALYASLRSVLARSLDEQEGYVAEPSVALQIPSRAEIESRWPGMPPDDVEALRADYEFEADTLGELVLDDLFERIKTLAQEDHTWETSVAF